MSIRPIWPWLFPLIALCFAVYCFWRNWGWWRPGHDAVEMFAPAALGSVLTAVICVLAVLLGWGLSSLIGQHSTQSWEENWSGKMVAMRNADGITGSVKGGLFILSGSVDSNQVYHYYYTSGSAFKPDSWTVDRDTYVYEEDRTDGEIVQSHRVFVRRWLGWIAEPEERHRMDFHIPKGSLKQSFAIE